MGFILFWSLTQNSHTIKNQGKKMYKQIGTYSKQYL